MGGSALSGDPTTTSVLGLRTGELVEIRSEREILATLDDKGMLDALPFMPEMLAYCGQRVRVYKRADKTCDTIERSGGRRMTNTVHLADLRCDGQAHGGCQAGCMLFWKEAWLKRVPEPAPPRRPEATPPTPGPATFDRARLLESAQVEEADPTAERRYRCQATELRRASSSLAWWDVRQYVRDVRCGNVGVREVVGAFGFWLFRQVLKIGGYRPLVYLYDAIQRRRGGTPYPFKTGSLEKTPRATLDLAEGDLVQVKSHGEILATLSTANRNHGLRFDAEMVRFCGGTYRVRSRVERLIDEQTGRMLKLSRDCLILDGVVCPAQVSAGRIFCPRSIFPYWREIWLKRVDDTSKA
jgi:hypothetical protein